VNRGGGIKEKKGQIGSNGRPREKCVTMGDGSYTMESLLVTGEDFAKTEKERDWKERRIWFSSRPVTHVGKKRIRPLLGKRSRLEDCKKCRSCDGKQDSPFSLRTSKLHKTIEGGKETEKRAAKSAWRPQLPLA